jgi:iron complex outermembrane receptor protein
MTRADISKLFSIPLLMAATVASLVPQIALSQDATSSSTATKAGDETQLEAIEVTGSRLRSLTADSPSPIQVITAQDIQRSGVTNIQELLLKIPAMGTPAISRTNSNFSTASAGVSTVDLRDLGTDRTLVLVNGRRYVAGVPGSTAVDLNTIPTDFIERVEIFTGGASAVYGSDAMSGVVNIILKRRVQGVAFDMSKGQSAEGDDKKEKLALTTGITSADGRGDLMMHLGYSNQGIVRAKDREGNEIDNISRAFLTGDPADMFIFDAPFLSSFSPAGRVFTTGGSRTFDQNGNVIPVNTNGSGGATPTGFNRQEFRTLAIPTERYLFASQGELKFTDAHSAFFEGTYAQTQTKTELEPFPLDSADSVTGLYPATGNGPAEFDVNGVTVANPLIPASLLAMMTDTDGDGFRDYSFTKRMAEVANRGNTADRNTFRVLSGVKGDLPVDLWRYELFASYASNTETQVSSGQVNVLNFRNAMEAIPDSGDVDGDGNTTEAICRDAQARSQGCAPANVFGFNMLSDEAITYITAPSLLSTFTDQRVVGGNVSGEVLDLWAGPLGIAVGAEYREEYSRSEFDPLQQAGLNAGNKIPRTEGAYDVLEGFAEVKLPLVTDAFLAKTLLASAAYRQGDYSTVGNVVSYTLGLEWEPIERLRSRGTISRSTRAPNINELFSPPSQNFPQVSDPCEGVTNTDNSVLGQRCRAAPGVQDNMNANGGVFTLNQADLQGTSGFDRGNPNVAEEVGNSWTIGLVWQPSGLAVLENASFEIDFFNIDINDAIVSTPRQFILEQCYSGGDTSFCEFVTRRPTPVGANSAGSLQRVDTAVSNSGGLESRGMDVTIDWADSIGFGRLQSQLRYSHLFHGFVVPLPGATPDHFAGEVGSAKDKAAWLLGFQAGPWSVRTMTTYIAESELDDQLMSSFGADAGSITVPSKTYVDLQAGFDWRVAEFYIGVDNLFDTDPPRFDTNALITGGSTGAGTAADVYDAIGQRYYAGVRFEL